MGPADLHKTLSDLRTTADRRVIVDYSTSDDASVFEIQPGVCLVQTVDYITPVVDDAYTFGRISAINSMSDIYAMGGVPSSALSILSYSCEMDADIIRAVMQGAMDEASSADCSITGGHTVSDKELKFGLSVTGLIDKNRIYRNNTAKEGDAIIYTKKLGIGIATTSIRFDMISPEETAEVTDIMLLSNMVSSNIMKKFRVSACTDVTGFGLAGHAYEMAAGAGLTFNIDTSKLKILGSAERLAAEYIVPAGVHNNMDFLKSSCNFEKEKDNRHLAYFDPQTSGGLLFTVEPADAEDMKSMLQANGYADAEIIGEVSGSAEAPIVFES